MRRMIVGFILLISTIFWTGCSAISDSSSGMDMELTSEIKLHDNSLIPNEFLQEGVYKPINYSTQQAMWFAYMDYEKILLERTEEEFTKLVVERLGRFVMRTINQSCFRGANIFLCRAILIHLK